jgi:hypothetical protein
MSCVDDILAFAKKCETLQRKTHAKATTILQKRIIKDTPIKTGRLRANWQATVGETAPTIGIYNGKENYAAEILAAIKNGEQELEFIGIDDTSHITNNVNYGYDLEMGTSDTPTGFSKQAPGGFVRINTTPVIWDSVIKQAVREAK